MKRILIIITRMYATRGDARDEFVEVWHGGVNTEHRIFTSQTGTRQDHVLVIHGYEYPQSVERAVERACTAIETALSNTELVDQSSNSRTGVVLHPRQSWAPAAQRRIADGVTDILQRRGFAVDFVESYHHGSVLDKRLAVSCLERRDLASELDKLWPCFLRPEIARYEQRFGTLAHDLQNLVLPLRNDLDTWRQCNFRDDIGFEILRDNKELTSTMLARARRLVLNEEGSAQSIAKIIWEVADKLDEGSKERLITNLAELEKLFSQGDHRFNKAEQLLCNFALRVDNGVSDESTGDTRLAAIRTHLTQSNPLDTWFQALVKVLDDLRQTLSE